MNKFDYFQVAQDNTIELIPKVAQISHIISSQDALFSSSSVLSSSDCAIATPLLESPCSVHYAIERVNIEIQDDDTGVIFNFL